MKKFAMVGAGLAMTVLMPASAWAVAGTSAAAVPPPRIASAGDAQPSALAGPVARSGQTSRTEYGVRSTCAPTDRSPGGMAARASGLAAGCHALRLTKNLISTAPQTAYIPGGYSPAALAKAYALPATVQESGTVGILDAGSYPELERDLGVYRAQFKLPPCTTKNGCLRIVGQDGGPPPAPATTKVGKNFDGSASTETSLDVDAASAACPSCKLLVVLAQRGNPNSPSFDTIAANFATSANTAVRLGANAISMSWGFPATPYLLSGWRAAAFDHPGIPITIASGDNGYLVAFEDWPQVLPGVINVGGTSLYPALNARGYAEAAWFGSGSGCGSLSPGSRQPAWVTAPCHGGRAIADISADADPLTGYATYNSVGVTTPLDGWSMGGGTSAAAPFVAALYARAGGGHSVDGPSGIYAASRSSFFDVTIGANATAPYMCKNLIICVAREGWDAPTGRGTPNGLAAFR
jgi:subtilase family serine protease